MTKRWITQEEPETGQLTALAEAINVSQPIATILLQRGVDTFEKAKAFFRPQLDQLHDPMEMKGMDLAVERLLKAIDNKEKIVVYGDYDVDGTTAVALFFGALNSFYPQSTFYIPDRYKEGYGISKAGIDWAADNDYSLIVALDCGIKSVDLVDYAKSKGVDFIICDHHLPGETVPNAVAVLDPKQADCPYPYKELSGCGIGFKLLQALADHLPEPYHVNPLDYLDLVVVSIAADIVPITGENRILAHFGLKRLHDNPRLGLKALISIAGIHNNLTISGIVFGIAPRINASGRLKHAKHSVDILLAESLEEAMALGKKINLTNNNRRTFDQNITKEAITLIEESETLVNAKTTVLFKEDWHKGVVGIVASRCIEKYHRPTIILTASDNKATGSARSVPGFDVYEAISSCAEYIEQWGGHKYAAGLTLSIENIPHFQKKFEEVVAARITDDQLIPQVNVDTTIQLDQITGNFFKILQQMAPFGPGNRNPVFQLKNAVLRSTVKVIKDQHLKFKVGQLDHAVEFETIGFNLAPKKEELIKASVFDVAFTIEKNTFRGITSIQLNIKDIKF